MKFYKYLLLLRTLPILKFWLSTTTWALRCASRLGFNLNASMCLELFKILISSYSSFLFFDLTSLLSFHILSLSSLFYILRKKKKHKSSYYFIHHIFKEILVKPMVHQNPCAIVLQHEWQVAYFELPFVTDFPCEKLWYWNVQEALSVCK